MNSEKCVTVLNVGHGNAAVIRDGESIVIVDTGGRNAGSRLLEYLRSEGHLNVDALLLSHADEDHIGSAPTLLLAQDINIKSVFLNSDSTKRTAAFQTLKMALQTARRERNTHIRPSLTISESGSFSCGDLKLEILYPPPEFAVAGAGGTDPAGGTLTTNSMSAVIRVQCGGYNILLPGDCDQSAIDFWRDENCDPASQIVVFPHHGGRPGPSNPAAFARSFAEMVKPTHIVFSIHTERHDLPREDVVVSIREICPEAFMVCTQLPERLAAEVTVHPWLLHSGNGAVLDHLHVRISHEGGLSVIPCN